MYFNMHVLLPYQLKGSKVLDVIRVWLNLKTLKKNKEKEGKRSIKEIFTSSKWTFFPQSLKVIRLYLLIRNFFRSEGGLEVHQMLQGGLNFVSYGDNTVFFPFLRYLIFKIFKGLFIFERERETEWEWGRSRESGRQNLKRVPGSRFQAVSTEPHEGLELTDREIMTWAEVRGLTDWAAQVPHKISYF